jgi:hypothetical protein
MLRDKIYESETFDEHLDFQEYIVLRNISERLLQLKGGQSDELQGQMDYLERKIYNYSSLYAF